MNNTQHGHKVIKNEKSGMEQIEKAKYLLQKLVNPIWAMRKELKEGETLNGFYANQISNDPNYLKSIAEEALLIIDEVITKLQPPTITDTQIELLAKEFRKENLLSVSFTPDVHSYIAGAKAVLSMMPQSEGWVKVEDRLPKDFTSVLVSDGNTRTTALYQNDFFYPDFLLEHSEVKYWMPLPTTPNQ